MDTFLPRADLAAEPRAAPPARGDAANSLPLRWSESHARSLAKAISWRGTGSVDTFVVTFVITGSVEFAGSVAVVEIMTKIVLYYLHERAWSLIPWGKQPLAPGGP